MNSSNLNKETILLIGAINSGNPPDGGEEYKNQELVSYLSEKLMLKTIDTVCWKKNPLVIIKIIWMIYFSGVNNIWISTSTASSHFLFRFLYYFPYSNNKRVSYIVVGGMFSRYILNKTYNKKYFHHLYKIVVQGNKMKDELVSVGLNNVATVPNFKNFDFEISKKILNKGDKVRFVFLSRIAEQKGVLKIFEAAQNLNDQGFKDKYAIDFFGPVEKEFNHVFLEGINSIENIFYKGFLDLRDSKNYAILSSYSVMLFPTFWKGEGFPGVIIDSYIAGLPVIATDWNMNKEVIENEKTGFLYKPTEENALYKLIVLAIEHPEILLEMRSNCIKKAMEYHVNKVVGKKLMPLLLS